MQIGALPQWHHSDNLKKDHTSHIKARPIRLCSSLLPSLLFSGIKNGKPWDEMMAACGGCDAFCTASLSFYTEIMADGIVDGVCRRRRDAMLLQRGNQHRYHRVKPHRCPCQRSYLPKVRLRRLLEVARSTTFPNLGWVLGYRQLLRYAEAGHV
jgi:hypothetical protein